MGEIGERQRTGKARGVGDLCGVTGRNELRSRASDEAPAPTEVLVAGYGPVGSSATSVSTGPTPDTSSSRRTASEGR